ncbi:MULTISPECIES: universal stress protein [Haloarcula]|uniref:universal stress protein n=1 Tax=Haloarcula TaxID=2237 RepID=UPI0023ED0774|nr:universal stress protein [Halomicroarcula sp. XH51]
MYRVLLPIDSNVERATAQASAVLDLPHASDSVTATVLHVFEDEVTAEKTSIEQTTSGKKMLQMLRDAGVDVETVSVHGDPEERIVTAAAKREADMIILGGRKRSPLGALVFGSVSQAVILDSDRPVTVTGSGVDGTAESSPA